MIFEIALGSALYEVAKLLVEKPLVEPVLEKWLEPLTTWMTKIPDANKADKELSIAFTAVIKEMGAPIEDGDALTTWCKKLGLDKIQAKGNSALRRQMAVALIGFTDEKAAPPQDLMLAIGWPRSRAAELSTLLAHLRKSLAGTSWQPLLDYANEASKKNLLGSILTKLSEWNNLMILTENGQALRVVVEKHGLTTEQAARIEQRYREDLIEELYWHNFRGIVQVKKDTRLPLADIYLELGLLALHDKDEQQNLHQKMLTLDDEERTQLQERRMEDRVNNGLAKSQRLVILGDPGTGKTVSLRFIALMLAYGYGAARIGLQEPCIPLLVRLADYAQELEKRPTLALDNYLFEYIQLAHSGSERLGEFLRLALEQGKCMLLLDGLDEVATDMRSGKASHANIVKAVEKLSSLWCDKRGNRVIVTSRIEGYWNDPLCGFEHVQLSPLRPPDEVEAFLLQWYTAHERSHDSKIPFEKAEAKAHKHVDDLLPRILSTPSVRRLASNPLLLTILALIDDNLGRLPNRRITLYKVASQTLIESWRQIQIGLPDELLAELGDDKIIRIMSPLAYWLHENRPGGAASTEDWHQELVKTLGNEGFEKEAEELASRFLYHARYHTGILTERSLGQFGFFHLTFEEYLAARQIARQRVEERRKMLKKHWEDPRWQEVILLAAGQLGIEEAKTDDASDLVMDLLRMEVTTDQENGRPALLAGRALVDIGSRSVDANTRRWVEKALHLAAMDLDPETEKPAQAAYVTSRVRAECADLADELGYQISDLYSFILIPDVQSSKFMIARYPVTNTQYTRFLRVENFDERGKQLWCGIPKFSASDQYGQVTSFGNFSNEGWDWLQAALKEENNMVLDGMLYPRYWRDARFGQARPHAPVVGISWWEANAYARWLLAHWEELPEGQQGLPKPLEVRLPTEPEWELAAGGTGEQRFAWGKFGSDEKIFRFANTSESGINRTTPVWMYPQGESKPHKLMDLSGNVWEWQANFHDNVWHALRGGSWSSNANVASVVESYVDRPNLRDHDLGFRVVSIFSPTK